jgi:hypothetical protein
MAAFTFEKLPAPPRPELASPPAEPRGSFNRLLDRFAALRLKRTAELVSRAAEAEKKQKI